MLLSVSIVVFRPDLPLLVEVLIALQAAAERAHLSRQDLQVSILNNDTADPVATLLMAKLGMAELAASLNLQIEHSGGNIGYGAANNIAIHRSQAAFHLVLNPDALVDVDFLVNALAYLQTQPKIALLLPQVVGFAGEMHYLCKRHPSLFDLFMRGFAPSWLKRRCQRRMDWFEMREHDYQAIISPVPYPTGCCMLFRTEVLQSLGGFDERFFMYLEDADIGRRINQVASSAYVPTCVLQHQWARGSHRQWRLRWITIKSAFIYWCKWGGVWRGSEDKPL